MRHPPTTRRAFTLIELMISIALGAVICSATLVAIRTCSQCVTQANRLSLENQLFRAGLTAALDDIDFWTSLDDPCDATRQKLRAPMLVQANPFRPYDDAGHFDFDHSDAKNWWRGPSMPLKPYGDYSLFSRVGFTDLDGNADPVKALYPERLKKMADTLGYYALMDYFPSSSIYQYFDADGSQSAEFSVHAGVMGDPRFTPRFYINPWHHDWAAGTSVRLTHGLAYAITAQEPWIGYMARGGFSDGYAATDNVWGTTTMHRSAGAKWPLVSISPAHWPEVTAEVRRFFYCGHAVAMASVVMHHPLNGSITKLQLTALGTTLRGARQQRGLDNHARNLP